MFTGPIGSISGCFLWFTGDSIGSLSSGDPINYWQDLSGSGNNVTVINGISGQAPTYIPNVINDYPVVRFNGSDGLVSNTNDSLNLTNNNLTLFTVFSTTLTGIQPITSIDIGTQESRIVYISALDGNNNFDFLTSAEELLPISGFAVNQFAIRTDRFDQTGYGFIDYFNQTLVSGSPFTLGFLIPPTFNIGFTTYDPYTTFFQGDIAEIVGYNLPLNDSDKDQVYNYLFNKYFGPSSGNIPTPPSFQQPTDISGLFGWYRSTSLGITGIDGSVVTYWQDDSGSGNHLFIPEASSGIWSPPMFYRNQFNIYPSVRFATANNTTYLSTNSNNPSLNFSSGDFTGFIVFKTNDISDSQCLYSIDSSASLCLTVEINDSTINSFDYGGSITNNPYSFTYANNDNMGTNVYSAGQTTIRHDRFRQSDGEFLFGLYGADIASGVNTTNSNINNSLQIGYSFIDTNPFLGDIAEVILYRRKLSDFETELVDTYLVNKYLPWNTAAGGLFIWSTTNSGIYSDTNLYLLGGNSNLNNSTTLYVGSTLINNNDTTLYELSIGNLSGNIPLYIASTSNITSGINLYVQASIENATGNIPLYLGSTDIYSNNTSLYIAGSSLANVNNTIPLNIAGSFQQYPPITLFLGSNFSSTGDIPLYIGSVTSNINNKTLFTTGGISYFSTNIPLYITNFISGNPPTSIDLFMKGFEYPTGVGGISLFTYNIGSSNSGYYSDLYLYLEAGKIYQSMPLYITTDIPPINKNPSGGLPLFIGDPYASGYWGGYTPLFLYNPATEVNSITKRLYIRGAGGLIGGKILPSDNFDLYICNNQLEPVFSGGIAYFSPSYLYQNYFQTDYWDLLASPATFIGSASHSMSLYIGSAIDDPADIPLYINSSSEQSFLMEGYFPSSYITSLYFQQDYWNLLASPGISSKITGFPLFIGGSGTASTNYFSTIFTRGF